MLITKLGEFGLIERFRRKIKTDSSVIKASGDDCAVLKLDKNRYQLFTCDMLVEGIDFLKTDDLKLIGRKALAVSVSDIAACSGIARYCLVSMGVPKNTKVEYLDAVFEGMLGAAKQFKINLVGGDLSKCERLTIDVSMLGIVEKRRLVLRSGARIGDLILVTGALGGSIRGKHLTFLPRVKEGRFLSKNYKINAMIDISDGLIQDLSHILKESGVGAVIYESLIPVSSDAKNLDDALYSGEDFELLFTMPRKEAQRLLKRRSSPFRVIGAVTVKKQGLKLIDNRLRKSSVKRGGFCHF